MPWQEIIAGSIGAAAVAFVLWRLRGKKAEPPGGPDVPVTRLSRKRPKRGSCGR
jgi:hypothetical protein